MEPIVIVGTGLAGYGVARELRKMDATVPIVLLSRDGAEQYAKPNLSAALAAGHTPERLVQASAEDVANKLRADVRPFSVVTAIDPEARTLTVNGTALKYRDLVLAVGADPLRPPFLTAEVAADGRVLQVNDLADYRRWRDRLAGVQRVVVIGAGLIGVEFASDLVAAGKTVTVVDMGTQPLGRLLPPEAAEVMRGQLQAAGVQWRLGQGIAQLNLGPDAVEVVLQDGQQVTGELILVAIGLSPRLDLARQAGLKTARAIVVDAHLATSAPHIYALGDCAEVAGQWLPYVAPLLHGAKALAATLSGQPMAVAYPPMPVIVKTPPCPTVVLTPPQGSIWQTTHEGANVRALAHDAFGGLRGFALMGANVADRTTLARQVVST